MKKHLKRIASPRTWHLLRKESVFITRPRPGAHAFSIGLPLVIILRDVLRKASTAREVKKLLHANDILVDGKRRTDHRFIVGLFDVISIPKTKESYRMTLDEKGRLQVKKIDDKENMMKICKVTGKKILKGNKMQVHLHDGRTMIFDKPIKVGDTVVLNLGDKTVKEIIPLQEHVQIFLTQGKHAGDTGVLKAIKDDHIVFTKDGHDMETAKKYVFATGKTKQMITI